jgi:hypothetical protein
LLSTNIFSRRIVASNSFFSTNLLATNLSVNFFRRFVSIIDRLMRMVHHGYTVPRKSHSNLKLSRGCSPFIYKHCSIHGFKNSYSKILSNCNDFCCAPDSVLRRLVKREMRLNLALALPAQKTNTA